MPILGVAAKTDRAKSESRGNSVAAAAIRGANRVREKLGMPGKLEVFDMACRGLPAILGHKPASSCGGNNGKGSSKIG